MNYWRLIFGNTKECIFLKTHLPKSQFNWTEISLLQKFRHYTKEFPADHLSLFFHVCSWPSCWKYSHTVFTKPRRARQDCQIMDETLCNVNTLVLHPLFPPFPLPWRLLLLEIRSQSWRNHENLLKKVLFYLNLFF